MNTIFVQQIITKVRLVSTTFKTFQIIRLKTPKAATSYLTYLVAFAFGGCIG